MPTPERKDMNAMSPGTTVDELRALEANLDPDDWDAHRQIAQQAATAGHLALVEEFFTNDASEPMVYTTYVFPDPAGTPAGETSLYDQWLAAHSYETSGPPDHEETAMGGAKSYEVFHPGTTGGRWGERTPHELSPVADAPRPPGIETEARTAPRAPLTSHGTTDLSSPPPPQTEIHTNRTAGLDR